MSTRREFLRDTLLTFAATTALARTTLELRDYHIKNLILATRDFFIDAEAGNDSWDGLSAQHVRHTDHGPWKTFRRIDGVYFDPAEGGVSVWIAPGEYESGLWASTSRIA